MHKFLIVSFFIFFSALNGVSQSSKQAGKFFNKGQYQEALDQYLLLDSNLLEDNDNFRIGACFYIANHNQVNGIKYLEDYTVESDSVITVAYFYLGSLYHKNYQFDKSIETLNGFLSKLETELSNRNIDEETYFNFKTEAESIISYCNYGKSMMVSPRNVLVENLGENINSKYQEYAPAISLDEKELIFTTRRPEGNISAISDDGDYYENIYSSELLKGSLSEISKNKSEAGFFNLKTEFEYSIPEKLPEIINGENHNASIQISNDGNKLYFYRDSDVWTAQKTDSTWEEPIKLADFSTDFFEPSVYITLDEKTMYITSEKEGGFGKMDIYVSKIDSNGNWSEMKNLGPKINTQDDEDISYVSPDNNIIYFSSKGHSSMGGYDIFKSIKKSGEWSAPINMGSPVNTPYNDAFFIMTPKYNRGYYSSERPEGLGGMDLYRLTFADERNPLAELAGLVLQGDSLVPAKSKIEMKEVETSISSVQNSKEQTGEYLLLVEHGKTYEMYVETEGFAPYKKTFVVPEQLEYYQLYQEIHHVYLRDSEGNIIGQEIITHNAFNDIDNALSSNDTLKQLYSKENYSKFVRDSSNSSVERFVDVKFYITEDSLVSLLSKDEKLKFIFPKYAEISFLYKNDEEFRYALNSYVQGKKIDIDYLRHKSILLNEINTQEELSSSIGELEFSNEKPIVILFDYNQFAVDSLSKRELDLVYNIMVKYPQIKFLIKGYTDSKGSKNYNEPLSTRRAMKVYNYLLKKGIDKSRLKYKGFGASNPIAPNVNIDNTDNPEGRALNRRVEFEMID